MQITQDDAQGSSRVLEGKDSPKRLKNLPYIRASPLLRDILITLVVTLSTPLGNCSRQLLRALFYLRSSM